MPYVLPDSFIPDLSSIRPDFEEISQISFDKASQPFAVSTFFGATDIKSRDQQTQFIPDWLNIFKNDLKPFDQLTSEESIQKGITARRIMVAVCIFLIAEIGKKYLVRQATNSTLTTLIYSALKLDDKNPMDEETRACCLFAAQSFLSSASIDVIKRNYKESSLWRKFSNYVTAECRKLEDIPPPSYPITSILTPALSLSMGLLGNTMGFIAGDAIGKSTFFLSTRYTITAALGSGILFIVGPGANMGVLLLAPSVAGKLLDRFCGLTLGGIMGIIMSTVGSGAGWAIGRSLDGALNLLYQTCCLLVSSNNERPLPPLTGVTLVDPHRIIEGCEIIISESSDASLETTQGYEKLPVIISTKDGEISIRIEGEKVEPVVAFQAVIDQLKEQQSGEVPELPRPEQQAMAM